MGEKYGEREPEATCFSNPMTSRFSQDRWIFFGSLVLLVFVPIIHAFRGLDLTDTGFLATNQQLLFRSPEHVSYWFHLWLTNAIGALVYEVSGGGGLIALKLASAVIFWITAWGVAELYRPFLGSSALWIGLVLSLVFSFDRKINIVHYNNLSALFYIWGIAFLVQGTSCRKPGLWALSGAVLALNFFVRLPNVIGLGLVLLVPASNWLSKDAGLKVEISGRFFLAYAVGIAAAVFGVLGVMKLLGHYDLYIESLRALTSETADTGSRYGLGVVLLRPVKAFFQAALVGGVAAVLLGAAGLGIRRINSRYVRPALYTGMAVLTTILSTLPIQPKFFHLAVAGLVYWITLAALLSRAFLFDRWVRQALTLSAGVILCLSFGSDTIISVSTYAFGAALPALFLWFLHVEESGLSLPKGRVLMFHGLAALLGIAGIMYSVVSLWTGVYRDTHLLGTTSNVPMLSHIATSPERAKELDEVVSRIQALAPEGSEVLMADSLGLLHFATKTLPYLGNPWPVLWTEPEIEVRLEARARSGPLPLVVLARNNPRYGWPVSARLPDRIEPFRRFVRDRGYELSWRSDATELWVPPSEGPEGALP